MRRIATLNDNEDPGSSIATPSRLHKPVELFREFVWAAVADIRPPAILALKAHTLLQSVRQRGYCVCVVSTAQEGIGYAAKNYPFHYGPIFHPD